MEKRLKESAAANGTRNLSQMHFARRGVITEEMQFVAEREKIEPELVRSEIARGRRHHSRERESPFARADGHRHRLPLQDQREHRQLRGDVGSGAGAGEASPRGARTAPTQ